MAVDEIDIEEEGARVAAIVAQAAAVRAAASKPSALEDGLSLPDDLRSVDVDLCLSLNDADAETIIAEADSIFVAIDADGNGLISREELGEHLAGREHTPEAIDRLFALLDTNEDGVISPQELRDAFGRYESANLRLSLGLPSPLASRVSPERRLDPSRVKLADELFKALDADDNNALSSHDFAAHLRGTGFSPQTISLIFNVFDFNQDGKISREEFRQGFARYDFSSLRLALGFR